MTEEEEREAAREEGVVDGDTGRVGALDGDSWRWWDRGEYIQQGWRALGCGVLGGMLGIFRRGVLVAFYNETSAAGSRHFGMGTAWCLLQVCPSLEERERFSRPVIVAVANGQWSMVVCFLSSLPLLARSDSLSDSV